MKSQVQKRSKRGAVELSMTTIIVVVIGITILTLGLRWIYTIFGDIGAQTVDLQRLTKDQIAEILGGTDKAINIAGIIENIKKGSNEKIQLQAKNKYPERHEFKLDMVIESTPGNVSPEIVKANIIWSKNSIGIDSGEGFSSYIVIQTEQLPLGVYTMRVLLQCLDCTPPQTDTEPVVFEITLK